MSLQSFLFRDDHGTGCAAVSRMTTNYCLLILGVFFLNMACGSVFGQTKPALTSQGYLAALDSVDAFKKRELKVNGKFEENYYVFQKAKSHMSQDQKKVVVLNILESTVSDMEESPQAPAKQPLNFYLMAINKNYLPLYLIGINVQPKSVDSAQGPIDSINWIRKNCLGTDTQNCAQFQNPEVLLDLMTEQIRHVNFQANKLMDKYRKARLSQ